MLVHPRADGQNVCVENDVFRGETRLLSQQIIGSLADADLIRTVGGLTLFIKGHDHDRRAVSANASGLSEERSFPFLHADRIHDPFAVKAFQACFNHAELRTIDHDGNLVHIRIVRNQIYKGRHGRLAVEQPFVHVDVDHVRATLNLLASHSQRVVEFTLFDQSCKLA